tara:strand:+ start:48344 stop:49183 length:840 start_codon:yes stop_codon:yes gene_type:complete
MWSISIALLFINFAMSNNFSVTTIIYSMIAFCMGCITIFFARWNYSLVTMEYSLDRNGIVIRWGETIQIISLNSIKSIIPASSAGLPKISGISWPGNYIGKGKLSTIGNIQCYITEKHLDKVIYLVTEKEIYGISVENPRKFAQEVQLRKNLGQLISLKSHAQRIPNFWCSLTSDRYLQYLLSFSFVSGFLMWLLFAIQFEDLPSQINMNFPLYIQNEIISFKSKYSLFALPQAASIILLLNLALTFFIYKATKFLAYLFLLTTIITSLSFSIAIMMSI